MLYIGPSVFHKQGSGQRGGGIWISLSIMNLNPEETELPPAQ